MTLKTLTDAQCWALANALRTAAQVYDRDAARLTILEPNCQRITRQLIGQATDALRLADFFQECGAIRIVGGTPALLSSHVSH